MDVNSLAVVQGIKCRNVRAGAKRPNKTFTVVQAGGDSSVI